MPLKIRLWSGGYQLFQKTDKIFCNIPQNRFLRQSAVINARSLKVAILGAAGKTGRCLSLLLKQSSLIDELSLYDIQPTHGLAMELSHIDTKCKVNNCECEKPSLKEVLEDTKIVMITVGKPYSTACPHDAILKENAHILSNLIPDVVKYCPNALVAVTTNPIDSMIPLVLEMFKKAGIPNSNRLFGVTTLDGIRANILTAEILGVDPECVVVPVIGGNNPKTRVPLFSKAKPCNSFTHEEVIRLTHAVKYAEEDFQEKHPDGQALCLTMAYAAARFCISLCKALRDQSGVVECAYVRSCVIPEVTYFATPLRLGPCGIQKHLGVPPLSDSECKLLEVAVPALRDAIRIGETLALGTEAVSSEMCPPDPEPCPEQVYTPNVSKSPPTCCN